MIAVTHVTLAALYNSFVWAATKGIGMFEIIGSAFVWVLETVIITIDPKGIVSMLLAIAGFSIAIMCGYAGNWTAFWIFLVVGVFSALSYISGYRRRQCEG